MRHVLRHPVVTSGDLQPKHGRLPVRGVLCRQGGHMNDGELATLRSAAEAGDRDAEDELVQGLAEVGDADGLRVWAQRGNTDAEDLLVELASEREDRDELARLAAAGNTDAAAILEEMEQ
jgi:hypothetical protein